jgi:hypothetical protein
MEIFLLFFDEKIILFPLVIQLFFEEKIIKFHEENELLLETVIVFIMHLVVRRQLFFEMELLLQEGKISLWDMIMIL